MAERKTGAGSRLSGVLEPTPLRADDPDATPAEEAVDPAEGRSRGGSPRKGRTLAPSGKKVKGRTIYLPDDLFERIIVQAHRKDRTISEYVTAILERQVPDHRIIRGGESGTDAA